MRRVAITTPTIDVILEMFFLEQVVPAGWVFGGGGSAGPRPSPTQRPPMTQRRLRSLEGRLRDYLEVEGEHILVTADIELLASERQFDPAGAFCRTMHADDLLFSLPGFLERCVPADLTDTRLQLATIDALTSWLLRRGLIDGAGLECILLDVDAALRQGREDLRRRRREARLQT